MMNLDLLFTSANLFVLPFWALIILLPNWNVTRRIIGSPIPFMLLAALYLYLLSGAIDPETAKALSNPKLADITSAFGNLQVTAAGWVHFLVMDLFVGRWIYLEGQGTGVWTAHSLVLCLFVGPLGLLSHFITVGVRQLLSTKTSEVVSET